MFRAKIAETRIDGCALQELRNCGFLVSHSHLVFGNKNTQLTHNFVLVYRLVYRQLPPLDKITCLNVDRPPELFRFVNPEIRSVNSAASLSVLVDTTKQSPELIENLAN
jgi:hypothetical protein